ncbi:MAG: hypothetical protein V1918_05550, partial [Planctomycetota bacterium]
MRVTLPSPIAKSPVLPPIRRASYRYGVEAGTAFVAACAVLGLLLFLSTVVYVFDLGALQQEIGRLCSVEGLSSMDMGKGRYATEPVISA